jgi:hypothetical protein
MGMANQNPEWGKNVEWCCMSFLNIILLLNMFNV